MLSSQNLDEDLKRRLLVEIAKHMPYSYEVVKEIFRRTQSIDATILICNAAAKTGLSLEVLLTLGGY